MSWGRFLTEEGEREGGARRRKRRACNAHFGGEVLHGHGVLDNLGDLSAEYVHLQGLGLRV